MDDAIPRFLFDHRDYELLGLVNDVLDHNESFVYLKNLLYPYLHPHGIKELAASRGLRIAYAAVRLLESLEVGKADDRITALRCLREEVMYSGEGAMHNNTARVLLEIMKELVRTRDNKVVQLTLAHDFRTATSGKPRIIRTLLHRYHLLEMPEEWNQVSFDDHVHDSNTKGRKTPSHLIMDAWIKGIRFLTVIYYNHVSSKAAEELLEAAEIMGITVRIGVEFSARFYGRYVQLIYVPRGFSDAKDFLSFLEDPRIKSFMGEGQKVTEYQQQYVLSLLDEFNRRHRLDLNEQFGLDIAPLNQAQFMAFVGAGQASILHLAKFIHIHILPAMQERVEGMREEFELSSFEERKKTAAFVDEMNRLDSEAIVDRYLRQVQNPGIPDPHVPRDGEDVPDLLKYTPCELMERLAQLHAGYRITLNLSNLTVEDVLELLYDCKGSISHLEIFNLKDYTSGKSTHNHEISDLQVALNEGNIIALKKYIRGIIQRMESSNEHSEARIQKFHEILRNIATLNNYYKKGPLRSRIGSDSTGHSRRLHGMGLVIVDTLPAKAQREVRYSHGPSRWVIPVRTDAFLRTTCIPSGKNGNSPGLFQRILGHIPGLRRLATKLQIDWDVQESSPRIVSHGNIVSLGGVSEEAGNGLQIIPRIQATKTKASWRCMNSILRNALKVLIGFIPAFATFYLTKDWWVLAYLGGVIWFGITGLRNIVQSVLGAGGIRRSPLLRWNSYVSWDRLSDSLLYTGFSVPLLDYIVKTELMDRSFGVTTATNPILLYTVMGMANGLYIFSHNIWRGLPKSAAVGNIFRSALSIPIAVLLNSLVAGILGAFGVPDIAGVLQKWAAVISKTASDCVAGVIEGLADRFKFVGMRARDYSTKLAQLFDTYAHLELIFPETDVLQMLESPKNFMLKISAEARDLEKILIINALDLLYFWMYQPRARSVLCSLLQKMSQEERQILLRSQSVLRRKREISQLLVNGIVGKKFAQALSLYLDRSEEYLDAIEKIAYRPCAKDLLFWWPNRLKKSCETAINSLRTS
ncbi:MAG: hypothetical protein LLG06_01905 [Desulfobacteraceae bacterium]|nr:hypothetical protein [Desulfobacteraceae bacterium]